MRDNRQVVKDGIVVGLIGYAAVALFYSAFDLFASRGPLFTVNMLGKALFRGLRDPSVLMFPMEWDMRAILAYNAVHLVIALLIGLIVTELISVAEDNPSRRGVVRIVLVAGFLVTVSIVGALTTPIRPLLPMWSVVAANALAMAFGAAYLLRRRPGLWSRLALSTS